jgi:hypothetical protein
MLIAVTTVAILSVAILVIAAFATGRGGDEVTGLSSGEEHLVSAPASGQKESRFEVLSGAETLVVRCADTGADLYRASTPKNSSLVPQATQNGDLTQLSLVASGASGPASVEIVLSSIVRWHLKLVGGGMTQRIECAEGNVSDVELGQGAGTIEVSLPPAHGTTAVRLLGGAGRLAIQLPSGFPVQAKIGAGAGVGIVTIDGQTRNDVAPGSELTPPDWGTATDRYLVDTPGGLASLVVDRRG